ncbi:MAG: dihydrofolate reductase [Opitutae bacterium]|nr:dihydrofolate reductase [Opitutae bacterium]
MAQYKAIAAVSTNGVIGKKGALPWRIPGELKWFKKITMGHIIVMGRKTWDSLPGPLPGRENWILSRTDFSAKSCRTFTSFDQIENEAGSRTVFIIGGGEVYSRFLKKCEEIFITEVQQSIKDGDAFFPPFRNEFECIEKLEENEQFTIGRWTRKMKEVKNQ